MIARHITLVVLIVSGVVSGAMSAHAQRELIIAPQAGATFASATFQQLGPLVLPERATGLSSLSSWMAGARVAMRLPLLPHLSILPSAGMSYSNAAVVASEPTTFAINGQLVPGAFEHTYRFSTWALEGGVEARYSILPFLDVAAGLGSFITTSMVGTHDMAIVDPTGLTFTDGSSTQRRAEGAIPERNTFVPFATASVIVPTHIASTALDVEVGYRATLASMVSTATMNAQQVFARIAIRFDVSPSEPPRFPSYSPSPTLQTQLTVPPTQFPAVLPPSATTVALMTKDSVQDIAPSVFTLCGVAFRQSNGRVTERGVVRMERSLMQTIDQGPNAPATTRLDTILRADPPIVLLRPVVSSDDSIATWTLRIHVADTLLFARDGVGTPPREIEWDCASISQSLFDLLIRDSAVVRLDAVGMKGGEAVPAHTSIRLVEGRKTAALDTSRINVTIWGYEVNSVELPTWALRTLAPLRTSARNAQSVSIYGSADGDGERGINQRIAEQRAQKAAVAIGKAQAHVGIDPVPSAQSSRNERDRRVRVVVKH